nr:hypothetical protein [Nonomuraea sp. NEAU-A123]
MVEFQYGPARRRMLEAAYPSIEVLPRSGLHVVIDEMSPSPISSTCGGQRRPGSMCCSWGCAARWRPPRKGSGRGLARGHLRTVHAHGIPYDCAVGPTDTPPERLPEAAPERQEHVVGGAI